MQLGGRRQREEKDRLRRNSVPRQDQFSTRKPLVAETETGCGRAWSEREKERRTTRNSVPAR
eukprot:1640899-Rhodomonas_salina.3